MERCLYCDQIPRSEEHPLPAALGEFKGGPTLLDRICKICNERRIGLLDEQFVRCGPAAVLRKKFNIEGRDHHDKVNSFYRGSAGGRPIKFLTKDESFNCEVLVEMIGNDQARQLSQLILKGQSGPDHHIPLTPSTTYMDLRNRIAALQLVGPLEVRLICDPPTEQWAIELFKQLWPDQELPESTLGAKKFNGGIIEFQTTDRYFRAIAKIGFHYFLTQFPEFTGHESTFDDIRDFIIEDRGLIPDKVDQFIGIHQFPITPPSNGFVGHFLCARIDNGECLAHFEPFVSAGGRMRAFQIRLGSNSTSKVSAIRSHLWLYYAQGKIGRFSGDAGRVDLLINDSSWFKCNKTVSAFNRS